MLTIYSGVLPNVKHNTHFYFNDLATYKAHILSLASANKNYELDNYRINNGYISIKQEANFDYNSVTYAILDENYNKLCYLVDRVVIQSGYVILYVSVDLWASYIYKAHISDIFINKCNRNIGEGIYTPIKVTKGNKESRRAIGNYANDDDDYGNMNDSRFALVIALNYNAKQNITGTDTIATTSLFAIDLDTIRTTYDAIQNDLSYKMGSIGLASDFAGGVYGVGASFSKNDATTLKAWVIDKRLISKSDLAINITSASLVASGRDITITARKLRTSQLSTDFHIEKRLNEYTLFGGINNGLELSRFTQGNYYNVYLRVYCNVNNIEVVAYDGINQKDITDSFELILTNNVSVTTELRHIFKSINLAFGSLKAYMKGGNAGALMQGGATITGMLATEFSVNSQVIGNGDVEALMNRPSYVGFVNCPYVFIYYNSAINEETLARTEGANFNLFYNSEFSNLFNYDLLGTLEGFEDTYLKGYASIDGIPNDARQHIQDTILEGVYLQKL